MNLGDLTVGQFQQLYSIINDKNLEPIDREIQIIALVENRKIEEVEALEIPVLKRKVIEYSDFSSLELDREKLPAWVIINRKIYSVCMSEAQMTGAQFIDFSHFLNAKDGTVANMHHLFVVMLRKRKFIFWKDKYDGSNHEQLAAFIKDNMPVRAVHPLCLFFCNYMRASLSVIENSLSLEKENLVIRLKKAKSEMKNRPNHFARAGAGSLRSITSATTTGRNGITSSK